MSRRALTPERGNDNINFNEYTTQADIKYMLYICLHIYVVKYVTSFILNNFRKDEVTKKYFNY